MGKMGTVLLVIFSLTFFGCGGESPKPTKVPIPPVGQKPAASAPAKEPAAPPPEAKAPDSSPPPATYSYNPQGKTNPFQPLVVEKKEAPPDGKRAEAARKVDEKSLTPLERLDLAGLKLVAVVWDIPQPRALVEEAGGKGYILSLGTRVGKNRGQVTRIAASGVVVTEKHEIDGKWKPREVPLRLYAE
jgi:type IV pilus assembly protein PilP